MKNEFKLIVFLNFLLDMMEGSWLRHFPCDINDPVLNKPTIKLKS